MVWLRSPPCTIIFDPHTPGVKMAKNKKGEGFEKRVTLMGVREMGPEAFTFEATYESDKTSEVVTIPYAAIHTLMSDPLDECHRWQTDYALAEARYQMSLNPMSKLLH